MEVIKKHIKRPLIVVMEGEEEQENQLFVFSQEKYNAWTQTPKELEPYPEAHVFSGSTDMPPPLDGSGSTLLDQYHENIKNYLNHRSPAYLSDYRSEIFLKIRQQATFQSKLFGTSSPNYDRLPSNCFSNFTVSLYLIIFSDHFTFASSAPGIEMTGDLNEEANNILSYISQGLLPPDMFDTLRKMNLVWYDGGLICEVTDQRKPYSHPIRVHVEINPVDMMKCGFEVEQEYLNARYPLICLEPNLQVAQVARIAQKDRLRFKKTEVPQTPSAFMQHEYPALFIEPAIARQKRVRRESTTPEDVLRQRLMVKLGLSKE